MKDQSVACSDCERLVSLEYSTLYVLQSELGEIRQVCKDCLENMYDKPILH